jgi:hypothetical protein
VFWKKKKKAQAASRKSSGPTQAPAGPEASQIDATQAETSLEDPFAELLARMREEDQERGLSGAASDLDETLAEPPARTIAAMSQEEVDALFAQADAAMEIRRSTRRIDDVSPRDAEEDDPDYDRWFIDAMDADEPSRKPDRQKTDEDPLEDSEVDDWFRDDVENIFRQPSITRDEWDDDVGDVQDQASSREVKASPGVAGDIDDILDETPLAPGNPGAEAGTPPGATDRGIEVPKIETPQDLAAFKAGSTLQDWPVAVAPPVSESPARAAKRRDDRSALPIDVIIGYLSSSNRKDVIEHARMYARDNFGGDGNAWLRILAFRDGSFFEVHEGGAGRSYLDEIVAELNEDPERVVWLPAGTRSDRVIAVGISERRPYGVVLSERESIKVRSSGVPPVARIGTMQRLSTRGRGLILAGAILGVAGLAVLATGISLTAMRGGMLPLQANIDPSSLPHSQIIRVSEGILPERFVSRVFFQDGQWRAEFQDLPLLDLPVDNDGALQRIEEIIEAEVKARLAEEARK